MKKKELDYYQEAKEHYEKLKSMHRLEYLSSVIRGVINNTKIEPVNSYQVNKEEAITVLLIHDNVPEDEIRSMTLEEKLTYIYLFEKPK